MHLSTIKSSVKKEFPEVNVLEIKKHKFGIFSVKVEKPRKRVNKIGLVFGAWNGGDPILENIEWI